MAVVGAHDLDAELDLAGDLDAATPTRPGTSSAAIAAAALAVAAPLGARRSVLAGDVAHALGQLAEGGGNLGPGRLPSRSTLASTRGDYEAATTGRLLQIGDGALVDIVCDTTDIRRDYPRRAPVLAVFPFATNFVPTFAQALAPMAPWAMVV